MTTPADTSLTVDTSLTLDEVARLVPNRRGTKHVHPKTIVRRYQRGEFPRPDIEYSDGSKIWKSSTLRAAKIL